MDRRKLKYGRHRLEPKKFYKAPPGVSVMLTQDQMSLIIIAVRDYMIRISKSGMEKEWPDNSSDVVQELIILHELENIKRRFGFMPNQNPKEPSYFCLVQREDESHDEFIDRVGDTRHWLEYDPERDNDG